MLSQVIMQCSGSCPGRANDEKIGFNHANAGLKFKLSGIFDQIGVCERIAIRSLRDYTFLSLIFNCERYNLSSKIIIPVIINQANQKHNAARISDVHGREE